MARYTKQLPPVLVKSTEDHSWSYLLETVSGWQIIFSGAQRIDNDWLHLLPCDDGEKPKWFRGPLKPNAFVLYERGLDIRMSVIAWVADGHS